MDEKIHRWLAVAAFAIALTGFLGWRSLGSADPRRVGPSTIPVPSPQLNQVMQYAAPLSDTVRFAATVSDTIVVPRDPFSPQAIPRAGRERIASVGDIQEPTAALFDHTQWRVTATLMAGTRSAAVINDALVYVGDSLPGGGKLKSVERDRVVVTDSQGVAHTLSVKDGDA